MIKKALLIVILAVSPLSLFAGVTMVTQTTQSRTGCDFRVDKCNTSVATDPSYYRFKDGTTIHGPSDVGPSTGDTSSYRSSFGFKDYGPLRSDTIEELLADIRAKLSNCPDITFSFDEDTGELTVHYLKTECDCDCDWSVNVRDIKASDFVWKRTTDNYSSRLGQMERRKFHAASEQDAQDIQSDVAKILAINNWTATRP